MFQSLYWKGGGIRMHVIKPTKKGDNEHVFKPSLKIVSKVRVFSNPISLDLMHVEVA